jgi:uncharacterized membrane protein YccC
MSGHIGSGIADTARFAAANIVQSVRTFAAVCTGIDRHSPAARAATTTTLAVVLAVPVACAMHLTEIWWVAISAYMMASPKSVARGIWRTVGTVAGAMLAILSIGWLAYDPVACCLALFVVTVVGILGFNVSRHSYGWLFAPITFGMVLLTCLTDPRAAFAIGVGRIIEVMVGTGAAILVATIVPDGVTVAAPPLRGWSDLLGSGLPITMHAVRSGLTVGLMPIIWSTFALPGGTQMAITLVAVLATPVLADADETHRRIIGRGLQRLLGCALGGVLALALLGVGFDAFLPWLIALAAAVWLFAYVQHGDHEVTYVGTQAGVVFISTLVQGTGPPQSILPGIDRFTGMSLGLLVLFLAMLLIVPLLPDPAPPRR